MKDDLIARAEAAEARVSELEEALEKIIKAADHGIPSGVDGRSSSRELRMVVDNMCDRARTALSAGKEAPAGLEKAVDAVTRARRQAEASMNTFNRALDQRFKRKLAKAASEGM